MKNAASREKRAMNDAMAYNGTLDQAVRMRIFVEIEMDSHDHDANDMSLQVWSSISLELQNDGPYRNDGRYK